MHALNERTKVWLHSMTAEQEVSKFLCNRALLLHGVGRSEEALMSVEVAQGVDPGNPACFDIVREISMRTSQRVAVVPVPVPVKPSQVTPRVSAPRPKLPFPEFCTDPYHQLVNEQSKLYAAGHDAGTPEYAASLTRIRELVDTINRRTAT